jgi:multidrug efflux pump subunit AcrB
MNPIVFAMRRPLTVMVLVVAVALGSILALTRMSIDIFPNLNLPVVYVAQPYGGMDPAQMEGLLTNYYEYHFLYINGIHHVESRNIQGMALMKLYFHPGTNMAQAMAEVIGYVTRSRAFMPPGTVSTLRFTTTVLTRPPSTPNGVTTFGRLMPSVMVQVRGELVSKESSTR